ncbi:MAG: polysaccharide deacetylase family protein [Candidatus Saliniplasma sp.]
MLKLIKLADKHGIPITFSVASEYIPDLSDDVKELMMEPQHEIITHGHSHSDITGQDQNDQLNISKQLLENTFNKTVKGMVAPQAKHDMNTLKAAKNNGIEYISAGTLSYIRYWSFPYPFKKNGIWLIGGSIPSDHFLYHQKGKRPEDALEIWKSALIHRSKKGWFTQLEYHNFSTSEEELKALEKLFQFISNKKDLEPITQGQFIERIEERV